MLSPEVQSVISTVHIFGYPAMFIIMVIEGPMMTFFSSFAASLGYFDPLIVIVLAVLGNIIPDAAFFLAGRFFSRRQVYDFFRKKIGVDESVISYVEASVKKYPGRMLFVMKILPYVPPFGFTLSSILLPSFQYFIRTTPISIFYATLFFTTGYYAGKGFGKISGLLETGELILIGVSIVIIIAFGWYILRSFIRKKFYSKLGRQKPGKKPKRV